MTSHGIADKVLEHIRLRGPSRAKQIADALGVERTLVNKALYGPLRGQVRQAKDYTWSLAKDARGIRGKTASSSKNSYASLFEYYLDCLAQDDNTGVTAIANSKRDLDYVELEEWPFEVAQPTFEPEPLRKLANGQRRDAREKALWLGYPVRVRHARRRMMGAEGPFIEPLLIWPQDTDAETLAFLPEPTINIRALEGLGSESLQEEAAQLANELGLDSSEAPPFDELVARLRDIRPEWDWKEELAPAPLRAFGDLREITETGIYNSAIVVLTDRIPIYYWSGTRADGAPNC